MRLAEAKELVSINKQVKENEEADLVWCIFGGAPELWKSSDPDARKQRLDELMLQVDKMSKDGWDKLVANYKAKNEAKSGKPQAQPNDQDDRDERDRRPHKSKWPAYLRAPTATNVEVGTFRRMTKDEQWEVIDKYNDEEIDKKKKEEEDKIALAKLRANPLWPNDEEYTEINEYEYNAVHGATPKIVLEARERAKAYRQGNPEEWEKAHQTPGPKRLLKWSLDMVYLSEPERNEIRAKVPPQPECEPPADPRLLEEWKGPTEDMLVTKDEWLARYALTESLRLEARKRVLALRDYLQNEFVKKHECNIMCKRDCNCVYQENDPDLSELRAARAIVAYEDATRWHTLSVDVYRIWGEYNPCSEYFPRGLDTNAVNYSDEKKAELICYLAETKADRFWRHYDHLPPAC